MMNKNAYKLLTYKDGDGRPRAGLLVDEDIIDVAKSLGDERYATTLSTLEDWSNVAERLLELAALPARATVVGALGSTTLLAPVHYPGTYFCAASNYRDHHEAMAKKSGRAADPANPHELGIKPFHFTKSGKQATVGPGEPITKPHFCEKFDWEIELAAVIGKPCKRVGVDAALDYVAGYCVGNDLSVRDGVYMKRPNVRPDSPFNSDFLAIKAFDQSAILGPWMTPAGQIGDPANLGMKLWVDDDIKQDSNSSNMIFSIAEQIAYLSERITLLPGDVILTGTPAGTGAESGTFLERGQTIRMWIENIGETKNTIV
jgi:2-keto-4-pentenoate hydratase/2-oxohepta-3-ene-1,7-dioic acid hydratase in catechol pathway